MFVMDLLSHSILIWFSLLLTLKPGGKYAYENTLHAKTFQSRARLIIYSFSSLLDIWCFTQINTNTTSEGRRSYFRDPFFPSHSVHTPVSHFTSTSRRHIMTPNKQRPTTHPSVPPSHQCRHIRNSKPPKTQHSACGIPLPRTALLRSPTNPSTC